YEVFTRDEELRSGTTVVSQSSLGKVGVDVKWGAYRLEVRDPKSGAASSHRFYAGWGGAASGPDRPDSLQVEFDQKTYSVGDTAKVFVSPPFSGKLVLVVAGKKLEMIPAGNISRKGKFVELAIKDHWATDPGVYVMPIVYRPGDLALRQQPGRAVGIKWMKMDVGGRELKVSLNAPEEVRPGQKLTVRLDAANSSDDTFITLAAVDDGVLGLTNYKTPNPFSHFFSQRLLAYEIRDTYGYLINPYGTERAVIRSGGDDAAGRLDQGLSTRSSEVVSLFSGIAKTNSEGKAEISFEVPQFSGRLRVMAVAWNGKQIGNAEGKVQVRDPVVADLVLPRFLAPGDRARATATFNNVSGDAGTYKVNFTSKGPVMLDGKTSWDFKLETGKNFKIEVPIV
ncbi:MAG: alpha-2-macroglobulin family protein, partial [Planctomycetota bacterium]|nr:alpha-2-macroglobulin family protein [Planctomycetota bacterium]